MEECILGRLAGSGGGEGGDGLDWLMIGTGGGCCECCDEPSGSCSTELILLHLYFQSCISLMFAI
jgi:hypothetical protein